MHGAGSIDPPTAFHMHPHPDQPYWGVIALHRQSETLWFLPPFDQDPSLVNPRADKLPPYFVLANADATLLLPHQDGLQMGSYNIDETCILVPKPHILTEALIRLAARYQFVGPGWRLQCYLAYMHIYVQGFDYLDPSLLPEPFEEYYRNLNKWHPPEWRKKVMRTCGEPLRRPEFYG